MSNKPVADVESAVDYPLGENSRLSDTAVSVEATFLQVADLHLDLLRRTVRRGANVITLQPREFSLLEVLMRNEGQVISRTSLLEQVWNYHFDPKTSVVETHVSRLRSKIDKPFSTQLLHTVRKKGYSLHVNEAVV